MVFAKATFRHWWVLGSCTVWTGLAAVQLIFDLANRWVLLAMAILALALVYIAAFRAWREERQRFQEEHTLCELERARNSRPQLVGEAFGFETRGIESDGHPEGGQPFHNFDFVFSIEVANQRDCSNEPLADRIRWHPYGHENSKTRGEPRA